MDKIICNRLAGLWMGMLVIPICGQEIISNDVERLLSSYAKFTPRATLIENILHVSWEPVNGNYIPKWCFEIKNPVTFDPPLNKGTATLTNVGEFVLGTAALTHVSSHKPGRYACTFTVDLARMADVQNELTFCLLSSNAVFSYWSPANHLSIPATIDVTLEQHDIALKLKPKEKHAIKMTSGLTNLDLLEGSVWEDRFSVLMSYDIYLSPSNDLSFLYDVVRYQRDGQKSRLSAGRMEYKLDADEGLSAKFINSLSMKGDAAVCSHAIVYVENTRLPTALPVNQASAYPRFNRNLNICLYCGDFYKKISFCEQEVLRWMENVREIFGSATQLSSNTTQ